MELYNQLYNSYTKINTITPIILNLTNSVTQEFIANVLLAIGASPIMSNDINEVEELIKLSQAININIGTLNESFNLLAMQAANIANITKTPMILDPVGAGASVSRTSVATKLCSYANVVRGNASEIMALTGVLNESYGIDSRHNSKYATEYGIKLAQHFNNVIIISGATDIIIYKNNIIENNFGKAIMTKVTGIGCALNAIIASFLAINSDFTEASVQAITFYTLCAEKAFQTVQSPAKFKVELIDNLYAPDWDFIYSKLSTK